MNPYIAILIQSCLLFIIIWVLQKDKKERENQYKKFLEDIGNIFYATMNEKEEE